MPHKTKKARREYQRRYSATHPKGDDMLNKKVAAWIIIAVVFIFGLLVARAFAETTKKIENSLGVSEIYQGRYSYLVALPKDGQILDGKLTSDSLLGVNLISTMSLFCSVEMSRSNFKVSKESSQ